MKVIRKDIFVAMQQPGVDAVCITTNGFVKSDGCAVMGAGVALAFSRLIPELPEILGDKIRKGGNMVHHLLTYKGVNVMSFPVKPIEKVCRCHGDYVSHKRFDIGDIIPGWACKADINIIVKSSLELLNIANEYDWNNIILPKPGAGAGELDWNLTHSKIENILDKRFTVVYR